MMQLLTGMEVWLRGTDMMLWMLPAVVIGQYVLHDCCSQMVGSDPTCHVCRSFTSWCPQIQSWFPWCTSQMHWVLCLTHSRCARLLKRYTLSPSLLLESCCRPACSITWLQMPCVLGNALVSLSMPLCPWQCHCVPGNAC